MFPHCVRSLKSRKSVKQHNFGSPSLIVPCREPNPKERYLDWVSVSVLMIKLTWFSSFKIFNISLAFNQLFLFTRVFIGNVNE